MRRKRKESVQALLAVAILSTGLVMQGCGTSAESTAAVNEEVPPESPEPPSSELEYTSDNRLKRPANHREWIFVGAPVTPNDMNDGKAAFPEFHNVYINPSSYQEYKTAGEFPNGTAIIKELVSVGGKSMDSGNGYFQGEFVSLEAMVKDTEKFSGEPGGWAFFRFGEAPDYSDVGARMKTKDCNDCHSGANEDYVFTDTYPVLRSAKKNAAMKK